MIKKPWKKIAQQGLNNYYILNTGEEIFLGIESVVVSGRKEFIQGLKVMPLYTPVVFVLLELANMRPISEKTIEDLGTEYFYDKINIKKVREYLAELTDTVTEESRFDYLAAIKSYALKRFIADNEYEILSIENKSHYRRNVWLAKSDKFGTLTISIAVLMGATTPTFSLLETYVFDREIALQVMLEFQKIKENELKIMKKLEEKMKK